MSEIVIPTLEPTQTPNLTAPLNPTFTPTLPPTVAPTLQPLNAGPNLGFLETLNAVLPYTVAVVVGIVAMVVFLWYTRKYMPPLARKLTKAYHKPNTVAFVQDEMGNIDMHIADKKFMEGVIHFPKIGWFLLPNPPPFPLEEMFKSGILPKQQQQQKKRGRPPKKNITEADVATIVQQQMQAANTPPAVPVVLTPEEAERERWSKASLSEKEEWIKAHGILIQAPILRGFGRQVFFGSVAAAGLSNLSAIAHADLPKVRALAPTMYQKTQLDALATGNRIEGLKMGAKDATKLLLYAIVAAVPIAVCGIIAWLLTQKPA